MAEMKIVKFDEDGFDLDRLKKETDTHAKAVAQAQRVRRRVGFAKVLIVISLFTIGYCLYYLASDLITKYEYKKYHNTFYLDE